MNAHPADDSLLPRKVLVLISLIQGLLLLYLHQAITFKFWPQGDSAWLFALYSMVVIGPLMALLAIDTFNWRQVIRWLVPYTVLIGLLGYYSGSQVVRDDFNYGPVLVWWPVLGLATFKALMYVQAHGSGEAITYSALFRYSWRNFLTLCLSLLFMLAVWAILWLWGGLFKIINITFFDNLFDQRWFYYPVISMAFGFGVIIFRSQSTVIDTITRIQQALMKYLLVFLVLVSILFLLALPFTGLAPVWETSMGSALILWMQALLLFFVNGVYQDAPHIRPYPSIIHRFIWLGIALLPIYSAIVLYGLSLRIGQYGWTPDRLWGVLAWALLGMFSLGYLWGIVRRRDDWLYELSRVNVVMGLVLLATMLLVSSPLLDFRKISVASQLKRLENNEVTLADFDFSFFRYSLARPGHEALMDLKASIENTHPEIAQRIDGLYLDYGMMPTEPAGGVEPVLKVYPPHDLPAGLENAVHMRAKAAVTQVPRRTPMESHLIRVDLNSDGDADYVLVSANRHDPYTQTATLFTRERGEWRGHGMQISGDFTARQQIADALDAGNMAAVEPEWQLFRVGDAILSVEQLGSE